MRAAAVDLFNKALGVVEQFEAPRAWAFALVGIHAYLRRYGGDSKARRIRETLAVRLLGSYQEAASDQWVWPEDELAYDNAKLPHALLLSGQWMQRGEMIETGLRSLSWLVRIEAAPDAAPARRETGRRGERGDQQSRFAEQPTETHALLEACIEAHNVTSEGQWLVEARRCFDWFLGKNPQNKSLYDYETGGCRDGLHSGGVNDNEGAESTLAWLLALLAIRSLEPTAREAS
jgi:hypothetical protein